MTRARFALLVLAACLFAAGCSKKEGTAERGAAAPGEEESASEAATARGVVSGNQEIEGSTEPRIVLDSIEYEWVTKPEPGLHVALNFSNPNQGYGRAKGSAFVIAGCSQDPAVAGVYPWSAKLDGGKPVDPASGGSLLFRSDQRMTVFIPYKAGAGCYDTARIIVYDKEGRAVIDETHELPITGEPTGRRKIEQTLVL